MKKTGGRPRVTEVEARVQVLVEDVVARRLKMLAINRGVLPSVVFRAALAEYADRHGTGATKIS
jgi:hypothetical protein